MADTNYTMADILAATKEQQGVAASMSAMLSKIHDRVNALVANQVDPTTQAQINEAFAEIKGNSRALGDAINTYTPDETAGQAPAPVDGSSTPPSTSPSKSATSTTVSLSKSQVAPGDSVTITAGVSSADGNLKAITGTVTFETDGGAIGSASVDSTGVASMSAPVPAGDHSITATYGGDANYASSTSEAVTLSAVPPAAPADTTAGASTTQTVASQTGA